ncbi:hypothetical protein GCM10010530_37510 [Kribbella aluminosa]
MAEDAHLATVDAELSGVDSSVNKVESSRLKVRAKPRSMVCSDQLSWRGRNAKRPGGLSTGALRELGGVSQ